MDGRAYLGEILKKSWLQRKKTWTETQVLKWRPGIETARNCPVFTMRILWCWPRCDNDWAKKVAASVASFDTFHALSAQHQLSRFAESCVAKSNVRVRDGMKDTFGCWLMVASEVLDLFYVGLPKNRGYSNLWQFSKYADQPCFFLCTQVYCIFWWDKPMGWGASAAKEGLFGNQIQKLDAGWSSYSEDDVVSSVVFCGKAMFWTCSSSSPLELPSIWV